METIFKFEEKSYKKKFYVLPKRRDEAILLGRCWINKKSSVQRKVEEVETCEELLEELYKDKPLGVKDFECEITTPEDKIIAEKPYKISQAYEDKIKDEIERLLNKEYISVVSLITTCSIIWFFYLFYWFIFIICLFYGLSGMIIHHLI